MLPPNLPTDNLYKFGTIFLLVTGIAYFYLFYQIADNILSEAIELEIAAKEGDFDRQLFYIQSELLIKKADIVNQHLDTIAKLLGERSEISESQVESMKNDITRKNEIFKSDWSNFIKSAEENNSSHQLLLKHKRNLDNLISWLDLIKSLSWIVFLGCFGGSISLMVTWYYKTQRHQDTILRIQASEALDRHDNQHNNSKP